MVEIRTRGERKGRNLSNTVAAGYSTGSPVRTTLADPLSAKRTDISSIAGRIAFYAAGSSSPDNNPLLLIHSVNAAKAYKQLPTLRAALLAHQVKHSINPDIEQQPKAA